MKIVLKILLGVVVLALLAAVGVYLWASRTSSRILSETYTAHAVEFPVPYPLDPDEIAELGLDAEATARLAQERAVERGRHLVSARYACIECHGSNMGGGTMIDAFPVGALFGPNLTTGRGSRTLEYTPADWDRLVRHGILPDGRPAVMPSEDFRLMSDQELSDIVSYIRSLPPVDNEVAPPSFGPLGKFLVATGEFRLSAAMMESHDLPHRALPPPAEVTLEFGEHLAVTCVGCHRPDFSGGRIAGGDPSWPPARNLTPHADALGTWSYEDFVKALQESVRPDGTTIAEPMSWLSAYARQMTDVELQALWTYLRSVPPVPPAN